MWSLRKRFSECSDRKQWLVHLLIMTGYSSVFLLVVLFLRWFQRDQEIYSIWHPVRLVGYYATFAIMYGTTYAIIGRLRKSKPPYKNSHPTDWMFLDPAATDDDDRYFHSFRPASRLALRHIFLYVIHMMVAIPMLVLEVPFAKWAHLAYRPVVLFLLKVKAQYQQEQPAEASWRLPRSLTV